MAFTTRLVVVNGNSTLEATFQWNRFASDVAPSPAVTQ